MPETPANTESEARKMLRARLETRQQALKDLDASKPVEKDAVNKRQYAEDKFNFDNRRERILNDISSFEAALKEAK